MKRVILVIKLLIIGCSLFARDMQLFDAGKKAFSVGLYSIALENLTQFLDDRDGNDKEDDAIYLCGISSYYLKKYSKSLTYLEALHSDYPSSPYLKKSLYWAGLNNYYLKRYDQAIKWFLLDGESGSKYVDISNLYCALSYIKKGQPENAKNHFLKVIENPDAEDKYIEESLYRLATLYLEEENPNRAINYLNRIIFDYSESKYYIDSLSLLGESYFLLNEWDSAKRTYMLLLDNSSEFKEISYKRLSSIFFNLGDLERSRDYLELYIKDFSDDIDVLTMLADITIKLGDNTRAIELLYDLNSKESSKEAIKENNYKLGTLYYKSGEYKQAYESFLKVETRESLYFSSLSGIKLDKDIMPLVIKFNDLYYNDKYTLDINNRYINFLERVKRKDKLEDLLKYITKKYPENITYTLSYGEFLLEERRFEESLKYLSKGYREGSEYYSNISYKIGWIYYNKGEYSRAIKFFDSIKRDDREYLKALYSKSIAHYQIGNIKRGREGFIELLESDSIYKPEVSFYLGMIEKDRQSFKNAISYFNKSKVKSELYRDSLDHIAWSYYHLKEYKKALEIYKELSSGKTSIYTFNAANCYFYLGDYPNALELYKDVALEDNKLKESAYYKVIEILFYLDRDEEGIDYVKKFYSQVPKSDKSFDVIFNIGDNRLYNGDLDGALEIYNKILEIFNPGKNWEKARFRKGEVYFLKEDYKKSSEIYLLSIITEDSYYRESVYELVKLLSKVSNPRFTKEVITNLEESLEDKTRVIPLYTEDIRQTIINENTLERIDGLLSISRDRDEIDNLIYLRALHLYTVNDLEKASEAITPLLTRSEVVSDTKIEALLLQASIYEKKEMGREAIDLYLKLYLNFSKKRERASYALYKGLMITEDINDKELYNKLYNILKSEFSDTIWGKRGLNGQY